jgi:hypothetical protein
MPYRARVVKRGSAAVLALAILTTATCGGTASPTGATASGSTGTAAATGGAATAGASVASPSFGQILTSAKATEYKVTYQQTVTGVGALSGTQSWYFKPPKTRFDFNTTVSGQTSSVATYSLPDGTYTCFGGTGIGAECIGMSGLDIALQQNPAALYLESMIQHPEQFNAVLVETRQIAGQQAACFDVKSVVGGGGLTDGRFCYSAQGIPLLQRFPVSGGTWSLEATSLSLSVPDSDFVLPAKPTTIGKP